MKSGGLILNIKIFIFVIKNDMIILFALFYTGGGNCPPYYIRFLMFLREKCEHFKAFPFPFISSRFDHCVYMYSVCIVFKPLPLRFFWRDARRIELVRFFGPLHLVDFHSFRVVAFYVQTIAFHGRYGALFVCK